MTSICPCGRPGAFGPLAFERCCGRYLAGGELPPDPESLMRSRYTAYALGRVDWLLATWDAAHRPRTLDLDETLRWTGLEVLSSSADGDAGRVRFVARWAEGRRTGELREDSRFVRRAGRWFYVDGDVS